MGEEIVELVRNHDKYILLSKMSAPQRRITILLVVVFVATMVAANTQARVRFNRICLLLNQVLRRCDKHHL